RLQIAGGEYPSPSAPVEILSRIWSLRTAAAWSEMMSRGGLLLHFLQKRLVSPFAATLPIALLLVIFSDSSRGYVLEGPSWTPGTVVPVQVDLGSAGRLLQDGNTSWDDAVAPVADSWNHVIQRVQVSQTVTPGVSVSPSDGINSVVFSDDAFGQPFGKYTLAVTFYSSISS